MSTPLEPDSCMLFLSALCAAWPDVKPALQSDLVEMFGPIAHESEELPFDHTKYYDRELGTPITRIVMGFETLVRPETLSEVKLATNALEERYATGGDRRVNLDPGLLSQERLVLATGKNFTHRIYLNHGIWADLTLIYQQGGWRSLPWTFQDYAHERMLSHLTALREILRRKLAK